MEKPTQLKEVDLTLLKEACQECLDFYDNFNYKDGDEDRQSDYDNDVFEKAMYAFFGENVFDFIDSKT